MGPTTVSRSGNVLYFAFANRRPSVRRKHSGWLMSLYSAKFSRFIRSPPPYSPPTARGSVVFFAGPVVDRPFVSPHHVHTRIRLSKEHADVAGSSISAPVTAGRYSFR